MAVFLACERDVNDGAPLSGSTAGSTTGSASARAGTASTPPAAAAARVFASRDRGRTWTRSDAGIPDAATIVDFARTSDGVYAAAEVSGLFVSRDGGTTWSAISSPSPDGVLTALASTTDALLAGTRRSGVFASRDAGKTWTASSDGLLNAEIRRLLVIGERVFAATNGGLFVRDAGTSWRHLTGAGQVNTVVAAGSDLFLADIPGVMRSRDEGRTWERVYEGSTPHNLAVDGNEVFAMLYGAGVVRTRDGGRTWDSAQQGLPSNLAEYTFQILMVSGARYAAQWHGVYVSDPAGSPWRPSSEGVPITRAVTDLIQVGDAVLAAAVPSLARQ